MLLLCEMFAADYSLKRKIFLQQLFKSFRRFFKFRSKDVWFDIIDSFPVYTHGCPDHFHKQFFCLEVDLKSVEQEWFDVHAWRDAD